MTTNNKNLTRRKFIVWGVASAAVLSFVKFVRPSPKKETVKMLTQDGRLVEVDIATLPSKKKKITNKELQNWIVK